MTEEKDNRRSESIRVRLAPSMMSRVEVLAETYGMPVSSLASFAIARFVKQEELSMKVSQAAVMASADKFFEKLSVSSEDMQSLMQQVMPAIMPAIAAIQDPQQDSGQ